MTDFLDFIPNDPNNKLNICRICALESENGQILFDVNSDIQRIAVQICSFISIKLEAHIQIYPNWICLRCHQQFEATYQFFEVITSGQQKLGEQFGYPRKPGRKPKPKFELLHSVEENHQLTDDGPTSENLRKNGKRVPRTPGRLKDSMQGNELEDLYSEIGVAKRRTRQSKIATKETIAHIEDENGVKLGEMLSVVPKSSRHSFRYQCDFCKESFYMESAFYNHLSSHSNIQYECTECQEVFSAKTMYDDHVRESNHTGLGIIETPNIETSSNNNPDESVAEATEEQDTIKRTKKFVCLKCPKSFDTKMAMQRHVKTHSHNRPYQCTICLAQFKKKYVLKVHNTRHCKVHPFKCHICSKRFNHKRSLQVHLLGIHEGLKPYSCPICKKCFSQKSNLRIHKRIHTGDRPFVCLKCGAAFKTSSQCHLHQKTHVKVEIKCIEIKSTLECKICGRAFSQRSNLRKHIRIHTGEKPYACNVCPKKFSDPSNLKKHKRMHPKDNKPKSNQISLLKTNLTEVVTSDPEPKPEPSDGLMTVASNSFISVENVVLPNANNSLMDIIVEDVDKTANPWNSDVIVTDIPNDENSIVQQQQQQELLMNQLVCISYQDPLNPVGSKTTFYVVN